MCWIVTLSLSDPVLVHQCFLGAAFPPSRAFTQQNASLWWRHAAACLWTNLQWVSMQGAQVAAPWVDGERFEWSVFLGFVVITLNPNWNVPRRWQEPPVAQWKVLIVLIPPVSDKQLNSFLQSWDLMQIILNDPSSTSVISLFCLSFSICLVMHTK